MTKFEAVRGITGVEEFARLVYELCKKANSAEDLKKNLSAELSEEGLRTLQSIAHSSNYPLSLDGLQ